MAYQLFIPPCCLDPAHSTHPPAMDQPLRIQIEGPKVSVEKLLPGIVWQTATLAPVFPQPAGPRLAALAYHAVYGEPPRPGTDDLVIRDEYLGRIMQPVPTMEIDYYGVTFDHGVAADDADPAVLQINMLEMEDDAGAYANAGLLVPVDPGEHAGARILAVPRCCQRRKGTKDRRRINSSVETRDALRAGVSWEERLEQLKSRGEVRAARSGV